MISRDFFTGEIPVVQEAGRNPDEKEINEPTQPITYSVQDPVNAIALSKDCRKVVVAGRMVFKVLSIERDEFVEKANLRVGKNINLNFSAADVAWNHIEENLLASAATNGSVVIWDLNKASRSKLENVYIGHKRTVNRVVFHPSEPYMLLSGSQDGYMKIFDLRRREVSTTFFGKESVRDVQFCPQSSGYFTFAAGFENGIVQEWDIRRPDRADKEITAHNGPVFTLDWNPEDKNWLATGGRDRIIKVWDVPRRKLVHCVHTMASVARIKWRPDRKHHIASCSLLVDFSINVWDIRRPFIPFAAFNKHKDVASGILWKNDPHVFLSCGRDGYLYQHVFNEALRPADQANPVGVDINVTGIVSQAVCEKLVMPGDGSFLEESSEVYPRTFSNLRNSSSKLKGFGAVVDIILEAEKLFEGEELSSSPASINMSESMDHFLWAHSNLYVFGNEQSRSTHLALSMDWLVQSAQHYWLSGRPFEDLCDHNAEVALSLQRHQVSQTWLMLKALHSSLSHNSTTPPHQTGVTGQVSLDKQELDKSKQLDATPDKCGDLEEKMALGDGTSGASEDDSEPDNDGSEKNLTNIASELANQTGDFFFDGETDFSFDLDNLGNVEQDKQDWTLPVEAFQLRHELATGMAPPMQMVHDSPVSANDSDANLNHSVNDPGLNDLLNVKLPVLPTWNFIPLVVDMLVSFAEQGDIQSTVSMMIVLGDKIWPHISDTLQENWFCCYVELLGSFKLWTVANEIIKLSNITALHQQQSTVLSVCNRCNKSLTRCSWFCHKCRAVTGICSVCHMPVKGLYVWCQGCSHGGHLQHQIEWFEKNSQCPTGCGHLCEYV